jgi:hypothetical protein
MASSAQPHGPFETLRTDVSDVLNPAAGLKHCRNFLTDLHHGRVLLSDFEAVILRVPTGRAFSRTGDNLPGTAELFAALSDAEKTQLRAHYFSCVQSVDQAFPELRQEFPEQFQ